LSIYERTALALVLIVILITGTFVRRRNRALAAIVASGPGRITLSSDDGGNLGTITRDGKEIYYRVTLDRVTVSEISPCSAIGSILPAA
jgi:DNA-binding sugar fermentation-stimulating protein